MHQQQLLTQVQHGILALATSMTSTTAIIKVCSNGFHSLLYTGSKSGLLDINPPETPVPEYPPPPGSHPPSDPDTPDAPPPPSYDQAMQQVPEHATLPQATPHAASFATAHAPQGSSPRSKSPSGKAGTDTAAGSQLPGGISEAIDRSAEEALQIQASAAAVAGPIPLSLLRPCPAVNSMVACSKRHHHK